MAVTRSSIWRRFRRADGGASAVEMALLAPILTLLFLGVAELGRFMYLRIKVQNVASNVGDLVARADAATIAEFDDILRITPTLLSPFAEASRYRIFITGVAHEVDASDPEVMWRRQRGDLNRTSHIGAIGAAAPDYAPMLDEGGDALVVTELFFSYRPWLLEFIAEQDVYEPYFSRPRRAALTTLE